MNLSSKNAMKIVFGIGLLLILFGIVQGMYDLNIDKKTTENISTFLLIAAAIAFFYSKKKRKEENAFKQEVQPIEEVEVKDEVKDEVKVQIENNENNENKENIKD